VGDFREMGGGEGGQGRGIYENLPQFPRKPLNIAVAGNGEEVRGDRAGP